jgi:hypothetical protein
MRHICYKGNNLMKIDFLCKFTKSLILLTNGVGIE